MGYSIGPLPSYAWVFALDAIINPGPDQRLARTAYELALTTPQGPEADAAYTQALRYAQERRAKLGPMLLGATALVAGLGSYAFLARKGR